MADRAKPQSDAKSRPQPTQFAGKYQPRPQRETVDERRARQSAAALAAQVDLKREAAERRDRKSRA